MSVLNEEPTAVQKFPADWSNAPKWANWWAMDATGTAYWYAEKPKVNEGKAYFQVDDGFQERCPYKIPSWKISLQQRPVPVAHPHAAIMAKYAEVAARRVDPWAEFEYTFDGKLWTRCPEHLRFYTNYEYRHVGEDD